MEFDHYRSDKKMKPLLLLWLLAPTLAFSQEETPLPSRSLLKFSPQHFAANTFLFGAERFNPACTRSLSVNVGLRRIGNFSLPEDKVERGFDLDVQFRTYLKGMAMIQTKRGNVSRGAYLGHFAQAGQADVRDVVSIRRTYSTDPNRNTSEYGYNSYEARFLAAGFTVGLQHTIWRVLTLDGFVGGGIRWTQTRYREQALSGMNVDLVAPAYRGVFPRIGLKIGVALTSKLHQPKPI